MMTKRLLIAVAMLGFLSTLAGCGSDSVPDPVGKNNPSEIKDFNSRREEEREKKAR